MTTREARIASRQSAAQLQKETQVPESLRAPMSGPVRRWEKRWANIGHLKLYKWVPISQSAKQRAEPYPTSNKSAKFVEDTLKSNSALRVFSDNAPITRSITAAFTKEAKIPPSQLEFKPHSNPEFNISENLSTSATSSPTRSPTPTPTATATDRPSGQDTFPPRTSVSNSNATLSSRQSLESAPIAASLPTSELSPSQSGLLSDISPPIADSQLNDELSIINSTQEDKMDFQ